MFHFDHNITKQLIWAWEFDKHSKIDRATGLTHPPKRIFFVPPQCVFTTTL